MNTAPRNVRDLLSRAEGHLVQHGVPNARRNAEWMLCHTLGWSVLDLYVQSAERVGDDRADVYWRCVERRAGREPLQYILGSTEFMALPFDVHRGVFVPRPDTEALVERAEQRLRALPLHQSLSVLDLCCGSGIIGVSLAHRIANLDVTSVDVSHDACDLTVHNAHKNGVRERVRVMQADAFEFLEQSPAPFSAILCNPPYIETGELSVLPREVREHEPVLALDGGRDGLDFYRRIIPLLGARLAPGGFVMFEIGDTQGRAVSGLLRDAGFADVDVAQDLSGRDRVVTGAGVQAGAGEWTSS
jgi:release factor glutamine methyltransferase